MKKLNVNLEIKFDKKKPNGTPRKVLDTKLAKKYGWKSKISLDEGFELTYKDFFKIIITIKIEMKKIIVVTGGAGFVGSNLIEYFLKKTNLRIISLDNYSSGSKKNHFVDNRVTYINGHTKDIYKFLNKYKKNINCIFILVSFPGFTKVSYK